MEKSFESPAGSPRSPKWPPRYSPPHATSRDLPLSLSFTHAYSFSLSHAFSLSLALSHAYDTRIRPSPSVLVRVKSLACAQHARAHARHSPKSILYVSRCVYEGTPSSFSTSAVTSSSSSCSACCLLLLPSLCDPSPPRPCHKRTERENGERDTNDGLSFPPSLLYKDPFSGWRDRPFQRYRLLRPEELLGNIAGDEDEVCFSLASVVDGKRRNHSNLLRPR